MEVGVGVVEEEEVVLEVSAVRKNVLSCKKKSFFQIFNIIFIIKRTK